MSSGLLSTLLNGDNWLLVFSACAWRIGDSQRDPGGARDAHLAGAMGWVIALIAMPVVSLPLYWVFGRTKFQGYVNRRAQIDELALRESEHLQALQQFDLEPRPGVQGCTRLPASFPGPGSLVALPRTAG